MRILFFGVTELGTYILRNILAISDYEVCGSVFSRANSVDILDMKSIAKRRQIDFCETSNPRDSAFVSWAEDKKPDVMVIATFPYFIPKMVYSLSKSGAMNIHPSFLPEYRGYHPYFWPIANGEKQTGVTLHHLSERLDEGDIIDQEKIEILSEDTAGTILQKQKPIAWKLVGKALATTCQTGKVPAGQPQPVGEFVMAPKIKADDMVIKWFWPTHKVVNRVRALNPHCEAYAYFRGEFVCLYQVSAYPTEKIAGPGTIVELSERGPVVQTGDGAVVLEVVKFSRNYLLTGRDFQKREIIQLGEVFL
jgi:methionyl-tRNA formyltransferase